MTEIAAIEWADCLLPPRRHIEVEREFKKYYGVVPRSVAYYSPWLGRGLARANYRSRQLVHLDPESADLILLAVSQDNSCRFCYAAQRSVLRLLGFDERRIRNVEEAASGAESDPAEKRALDFARRVSRANPAPGEADVVSLREAGYSEEGIKEVAYMAAHTVLLNRTATLPALPMEHAEVFGNGLLSRLLRPLVARVVRSRMRRGEPVELPPELRSVPFAHVPLALDGLPIAKVQARLHALAFEESALSTRAKALVFAVVARGLASARCEAEARRLLAGEGMDDATIDEVLAHLASPRLDPLEAAVLPFARETIRVRPIDIQRRSEVLLESISVEEFADLVGVIAVANATCRLSLVLCER